jgi:hypothetical protein
MHAYEEEPEWLEDRAPYVVPRDELPEGFDHGHDSLDVTYARRQWYDIAASLWQAERYSWHWLLAEDIANAAGWMLVDGIDHDQDAVTLAMSWDTYYTVLRA